MSESNELRLLKQIFGVLPVCSECYGPIVGDGVCRDGCKEYKLVYLHPNGEWREYSPRKARKAARGE